MSSSTLDVADRAFSSTGEPPLRVCLITEAGGGGVGRHFLDLADGLVKQGVEVVGIYSDVRQDAPFQRRLQALSAAKFVTFPMRRAVHPLDATDLLRLVRLIRQLGPFDLIHGHSSKGGAFARLVGRRLGIPSVYTPNAIVTLDPTLSPLRRKMYKRIERWLARQTGAIIAVSDDEAEHIRGLGIDPAKIHVVFNGIEPLCFPDRDQVRSRLGISPTDVVIGYVGRLTSQKAPEVLLDAFAALKQSPDVRLLMIGNGPLEAEIRSRIAKYGLDSRVMMPGDVVATDFMPAFDVFCLSSRYEGMPYVLLEALAAGLPIVATDACGVSTCVEPQRNGLMVPADNIPALAAALATVTNSAELRSRFAAASAAMATRYTVEKMVEQTLDVYAQALATQKLR